MTSYKRDGKVGPWAQDKLECLGKYLNAYTKILRIRDWCEGYYFVDAFAGAGTAELRKTKSSDVSGEELLFDITSFHAGDEEDASYINGSPKVALDIQHPFTSYFFIENNPSRVEHLRELRQEYKSQRDIRIIPNDASVALKDLVSNPVINWRSSRAVVFLDPFGMQVPWRTIEMLGRTNAIEVFLNLPVGMAIQRQLPKTGRFSESQRNMLTRYFGSAEWEDILYDRTMDLFGDVEVSKVERSGEKLAYWYRDRLKNLFGHASQPHLIQNSQGSHLYYLIFAGPNATGARIASEIFLKHGEKISR